ncbi:homeodomain-like protein [Tanacetum coccineum]
MPLSTYLNLVLGDLAHTKLTVELTDRTVKHPKGIAENVLVGIGKFIFPIDFIILDMLEDFNVPLILRRPYLSIAHAKVDVFKRKITLRAGDEKIIASSLIKREGEVVDEPITDIVKTRWNFIGGLDDYPSDCDFDGRIHIDCANNLKFLCMIGFEFVHVNFPLILPINVMSKKFYNSIMKDKSEFKGRNKLGNFINAPVFIGDFYVITNFTVVEDMDPYLDEGMGDVIVGEPFCKASCVEARRFDGIITISDRDDSVTYQMVRANPRFKHITNEICIKISPLLKVSEQDKMNGISHSYQKLKGFYKGVLNLGPEFIRDAKVDEWLIRGHISVHEME